MGKISVGTATWAFLLASLVLSTAVFGVMFEWINGEIGTEGFAKSQDPAGFFSLDGVTIFLAPPALAAIVFALIGAAWVGHRASPRKGTVFAVIAWLLSLLAALRLTDSLHCSWGTAAFADRPPRLGLSIFLARRNWACGQLDALPVASRALARSCCSVFPAQFDYEAARMLAAAPPLAQAHPGLRALMAGRSAWCGSAGSTGAGGRVFQTLASWAACNLPNKTTNDYGAFLEGIKSGDAVYVTQGDFPAFLTSLFLKLPKTVSLTVVVGQEDSGAPVDLWGRHPKRNTFARHIENKTGVSLEGFLGDVRLARLFVQNYDLLGCPNSDSDPLGCPTIVGDPRMARGGAFSNKVSPIPIGVDLHTTGEKVGGYDSAAGHAECAQTRRLRSERNRAAEKAAWADRPPCVGVTFTGPTGVAKAKIDREMAIARNGSKGLKGSKGGVALGGREGAHYYAREMLGGGGCAVILGYETLAGGRNEMWRRVAELPFALAPAGRGEDTHRFWELLLLGVVPVVLSSSLDGLYSQYPSVILRDWSELSDPTAPERWREAVIERWGWSPFSLHVQARLSNAYWAGVIQGTALQLKLQAPTSAVSTSRRR